MASSFSQTPIQRLQCKIVSTGIPSESPPFSILLKPFPPGGCPMEGHVRYNVSLLFHLPSHWILSLEAVHDSLIVLGPQGYFIAISIPWLYHSCYCGASILTFRIPVLWSGIDCNWLVGICPVGFWVAGEDLAVMVWGEDMTFLLSFPLFVYFVLFGYIPVSLIFGVSLLKITMSAHLIFHE